MSYRDEDIYGIDEEEYDGRQEMADLYYDEIGAFLNEDDMTGEDGDPKVDDFESPDDFDDEYYDNLFA